MWQMPQPSRRRSAPTPRQIVRRQWLVRLAKWLLPVGALALLGSIVLWPELERNEDRSRYAFRRAVQPSPEALKVMAPRYQGIDELGRPYTLSAEMAQQVGSDEVLDLTAPRADILMSDGSWVYIESRTGRYNRPENHLTLAGAVTIYQDNGTTLRTDAAAADLGQGRAEGDAPVAAQGPFGTLTAEGFRLKDRGAVVVFTGQAHAVLEGSRP
jgi:lipopolysaccharide export system protein LptC